MMIDDYLYNENCTGNFRVREPFIEQEIEIDSKKEWIPLLKKGYGGEIYVQSFSKTIIDNIYIDIIKDYKPILREKRLKQLLKQ